MQDQANEFDLAIIGMACRFPGAADVDAYWRNLCDGASAIAPVDDAVLAARVPEATRRDPAFVPVAASLAELEMFDAGLFGYTPREAELMDPQQRVFLECAWAALERAGHGVPDPEHVVGVYAGAALSSYLLLHVWPHVERGMAVDPLMLNLGNASSFLPTRVSYKLDLRGPSHVVECACSTSLVAIHVACQSLRSHECDLALAGGVSINLTQRYGYRHQEGSILSPEGRCRPFDAGARGIVFGSGAGIVVLRRLGDALADGDHIHAVIRGSAVNNDGARRAGFTAPGVNGQAEVVTEALANAGLVPADIGLVEAHGTGTPLGDPIELRALDKVFAGVAPGSRMLGSVKANVGHLDAAAGVAGLIKAALAVEHGVVPPSLHCDTPSAEIDWARSAFRVQRARTEWQPQGAPRRAGVSSFGMGGTNAHVIVEQPPARPRMAAAPAWHVVALSARTPEALDAMTARLADDLRRAPDRELADVAFTLQTGRRPLAHRRVAVCRDAADAAAVLGDPSSPRRLTQHATSERRGVVFLFPGQGAQHVAMAAGLYETEPGFREALDDCAARLHPHLDVDLRTLLFSPAGRDARPPDGLHETRFAQPALFAVEYALARLLMSWGVEPRAMLGHSVGEYVAACLAGVFSLDDALALIAARGQLMHALPEGAMLSVALPEAQVAALCGDALSLAAINAPHACVVSGAPAAIEALQARLEAERVGCQRLRVSRAFHSAMTEPAIDALARRVRAVRLHAPERRFVSNVTGTWIRPEEATDPLYWARHMRAPVRFARGVEELARDGHDVLLEVGPGNALTTLARQVAGDRTAIVTMRRASDARHDREALLEALGRLWLAGVDVPWARSHGGPRRRVPLPTYAFERARHWLPSAHEAAQGAPEPAGTRAVAPQASAPHASAYPRPSLDVPYVAPRNPDEQAIAGIWQDVLGISPIGVHDNFFQLGGHSLLATAIVGRLREVFASEVPLQQLFEAPTVAQCAALLRSEPAGDAGAEQDAETRELLRLLSELTDGGAT